MCVLVGAMMCLLMLLLLMVLLLVKPGGILRELMLVGEDMVWVNHFGRRGQEMMMW